MRWQVCIHCIYMYLYNSLSFSYSRGCTCSVGWSSIPLSDVCASSVACVRWSLWRWWNIPPRPLRYRWGVRDSMLRLASMCSSMCHQQHFSNGIPSLWPQWVLYISYMYSVKLYLDVNHFCCRMITIITRLQGFAWTTCTCCSRRCWSSWGCCEHAFSVNSDLVHRALEYHSFFDNKLT